MDQAGTVIEEELTIMWESLCPNASPSNYSFVFPVTSALTGSSENSCDSEMADSRGSSAPGNRITPQNNQRESNQGRCR